MAKSKKKKSKTQLQFNIWQISTLALAIALIGMAIYFNSGQNFVSITGDKQMIAESTVDSMNQDLNMSVSLIDVVEQSGIYRLNLDVDGEQGEIFVTKDGNLIFPLAIARSSAEGLAVTP